MAELLFEALGNKNQHEELRDFHSRFDRELDSVQASSKILDIHSTAKESTNHYPELLKDLLDCIPYIEPFGGDSKDRSRAPVAESSTLCSSFVPISSNDTFEAASKVTKEVVNVVENALENYTNHVKKMQSDVEFNPSGSSYLRNIYKARQIQYLARRELQPLAGMRSSEWKHAPIHDASILYSRKTSEDLLTSEISSPENLQQQQQEMAQVERGKYWKAMMEEEENIMSRLRQPTSRRPEAARPLTPRGSPTPMLEDFNPSKHHNQQQQQNHLVIHQLRIPPKMPSSPKRPPSSIILRQLPTLTPKPLRASISDTAIVGSPHHLQNQLLQQHQQQQFMKNSASPVRSSGDGFIPVSPRGNQHPWKGWRQQQQLQLKEIRSARAAVASLQPFKQPTPGILRSRPQVQHQQLHQNYPLDLGTGSSSRPPSAESASSWNSSNNNSNGNDVNQSGMRSALGASISPPPTLQAIQVAAVQQQAGSPQQHQSQHYSIWSNSASARQVPLQQPQPLQSVQQPSQQQQQALSFVATQHVLNGRRAFSPPASVPTSNGVSLISAPSVVSPVLQQRSVIGSGSTAMNGGTAGSVILQPASRLVEVKSFQPIQLVQARPTGASAATFLTIPATAAAAVAASSKVNGSANNVTSIVQPLVAVNRAPQQQRPQQQQQQMSPPRTWSSSLFGGDIAKAGQQPAQRSIQQPQQLSPPHPRPAPSHPWGASSAGGPFQVSLPDGKLIADNNRVWMDGIVSILEMKSKEGKEAAAAAAAINNSNYGITTATNTTTNIILSNNNDNSYNNITNNNNNNRVGSSFKMDVRK